MDDVKNVIKVTVTKNVCRHSISSTNNISLHLDDELYDQFKEEQFLLHLRFYALTRKKYGIWASNQGKFVKSVSQFNSMDSWLAEHEYEAFKQLIKWR